MRRRLAKVFEDGTMKPMAKHFASVTSSEIANDRVLRGSFWSSRGNATDLETSAPAEVVDLAAWRARRESREA